MSTVKANAIIDASGGNTATINSMTPTADSLQGFRNRIINGGMVIDQRNAGASVSASLAFPVDRFQAVSGTDGSFTAQRVASTAAGFGNALKITVTATDASLAATQVFDVVQGVEGFNIADLGFGSAEAQSITLSFVVQPSVTGTFGGAIMNHALNRAYPFTYTISTANAVETKTVTIPGDTTGTWLTDNQRGMRVGFCLGAGSDYLASAGSWVGTRKHGPIGQVNLLATNGATWAITGVQLEKGSTATAFDYRPYGTELALCQRYFSKLNHDGSGSSPVAIGIQSSTTAAVLVTTFPVTMRAEPTAIISNLQATDYIVWAETATLTAFGAAGFNMGQIQVSYGAQGAQYRPAFLRIATDTTGQITFSAEL